MKKFVFLFSLLVIVNALDAQIMSKRRLATENEIFSLELTLGEGNLTEVLWYVSTPIMIQREIDRSKVADMKSLMEKGKVKISGGKVYELAQFVSNVSGLYHFKKDETIAIRYENEEARFLEFELADPVSQDVRYYNLKYQTDADGNKIVNYGGAEWKLVSGSYAKLEYKAKGNFNAKVQKTKIRGLKKDGSEKKGIFEKKN